MKKATEKYFYPMSVSEISGKADTKLDILSRWDKFDLLSEAEKNVLISENVPVAIKKIAIHFDFTMSSIEEISRVIREVYFKTILKSNISHELIRKISSLTVENSQKISQILNDEIFNMVLHSKEELEQEKKKLAYVQMQIFQAMEKYPKLGDQLLTGNQIKLRYSANIVKPSIGNWIRDFHDSMGAGKHSPIDRGNYLFHSENTKKLTPTERQKLAIILKSLDEATPLTIDSEAQVVIFGNMDDSSKPAAQNQSKDFAKTTQKIATKIEKVENFFQIPQSKPPIGSDSYHAENANQEQTENEINLYPKVQSESLSVKKDGFFNKLREKSFGGNKNVVQINEIPSKQDTPSPQKNFSPNFASNEGNITFSSAHKLPVEQKPILADPIPAVQQIVQPSQSPQIQQPPRTKIENIVNLAAAPKTQYSAEPQQHQPMQQIQPQRPQQQTQQQTPQYQRPPTSPYRIIPSGYAQQEKEEPKVQGNVVDLS